MKFVAFFILCIAALFYLDYRADPFPRIETYTSTAEDLYTDLVQVLEGTYSGNIPLSDRHLLRRLLNHEDGWSYLEKLDQSYATILFRRERGQVYFLENNPQTETFPELCYLTVHTHESGGWESHSATAKYPHYLIGESLSLTDDQLSITCRIRKPLDREITINGVVVEAGQRVKFHVDISTFRPMPIRLSQLDAPMIL